MEENRQTPCLHRAYILGALSGRRQTIWVRKKQKQSTGDGRTGVEVGLLSGLHRMLMEDLSSEEIRKQELKEREAANHMRN